MYNLFIDDVRMPDECVQWMYKRIGAMNPIYRNWEWEIMRSYDEMVEKITKDGLPKFVSFDHDLADIFYDPMTQKEYFEYHEKTGLDCCKWMVDYCIENNKAFPEYAIHSMNEVGKDNIQAYIHSYLKKFEIRTLLGLSNDNWLGTPFILQ